MARSKKRGYVDDDASPSTNAVKRSTGKASISWLAESSLQNEHYNRELLERLTAMEEAQGKEDRAALQAALREHDRVRRAAVLEQERQALELEEMRQKQEDEERRELDAQRERQVETQIAEERRRAAEARRIQELEFTAKQEKLKHEAEARQREEQREQEERAQARAQEEQRKADAEAKEREARQQAERTAAPQPPEETSAASAPAAAASPPASLLVSSKDERDAEHKKYLGVHQRLKAMRSSVMDFAKENKAFKKQLGEWRRDIQTRVGQATNDRGGTAAPRNKISAVLSAAMGVPQPAVDIRPFLVSQPLPPGLTDADCQVPATFLYLVSMFVKKVVSTWTDVGGANIPAANPPGVLAISIFAAEAHKWRGVTLIDVLLAKLHRACPLLFGVYGSEATQQGKRRLGWRVNKETNSWIPEQRHGERMTGLGAGFSSVSLRVFPPASQLVNPYPPENWWRACARIVNTPAGEVTNSHLIVLKAMVESQAPRVIELFRGAGTAALRAALLEFPKRAPPSPARTGIETLPAVLAKSHGVHL